MLHSEPPFHMAAQQAKGLHGSASIHSPEKPPGGQEAPQSSDEGPVLKRKKSKRVKGSQERTLADTGSSGGQRALQLVEAPGTSKKPSGTDGQGVPGPAASGSESQCPQRPRPALPQDAAQETYGPLLQRIFGKVSWGLAELGSHKATRSVVRGWAVG